MGDAGACGVCRDLQPCQQAGAACGVHVHGWLEGLVCLEVQQVDVASHVHDQHICSTTAAAGSVPHIM